MGQMRRDTSTDERTVMGQRRRDTSTDDRTATSEVVTVKVKAVE